MFLAINGIEFPAAVQTLTEPPRLIGSTSVADDGSAVRSEQATKLDFDFDSVPMSSADAHAWANLIRGHGHRFGFETFYAASGLGPVAGYVGATLVTTHPKFGTKNLSLAATTGTISFAAALGAAWSIGVWRYESAAWHHYFARSTEAGTGGWYDGVWNAGLTYAWLTVASGTATIANTSGAAVEYDDLVLLPFVVPTSWPTVWGVSAVAFSDLARLNVTGDAVAEGGTRVMVGGTGTIKVLASKLEGVAFSAANRVLPIQLAAA